MALKIRLTLLPTLAFGLAVLFSSAAHAEWSVEKAPLGPGYLVRHDSRSPALVVSLRFRTKRGAQAAAKALNEAEHESEGGDHETGDEADSESVTARYCAARCDRSVPSSSPG